MVPIKEIRAWLEENPEGDLGALYGEFGGEQMRSTFKALNHLEARGEITISAAVYKYGRKHGNEDREEKQTTIYNFLRFHGNNVERVISMDLILKNSGATENYARCYLNFLAGLGYVAKRPTGWAVLEKAIKQAKPVLFHRRREDANRRKSA